MAKKQHTRKVPYQRVPGLPSNAQEALNRNFDLLQDGGVPTGCVLPWGGQASLPDVPHGWLQCNGQAVNRRAYANLWKVIGTEFGAGDGSSTFNVPNLSDRFIRGANALSEVGDQGGTSSATMPSHSHGGSTLADGAFNVGHNIHGNNFNTGGITQNHVHVPGGCHGHGVLGVRFSGIGGHGHGGGCGIIAEAPSGIGIGVACDGSTTCNSDANTAGVSDDHAHNANHGHGADNHSVGSHSHIIQAEGSGDNNPPYTDFLFIIKT